MDKCEYDELISLLAQCRVLATPHPGRPDNGFHFRRLCQVVERHCLPALNYGEPRVGWTILAPDGERFERTFATQREAAERRVSCLSSFRDGVVVRTIDGEPVALAAALLVLRDVLPILDGMLNGDGYAPDVRYVGEILARGRQLVEAGA